MQKSILFNEFYCHKLPLNNIDTYKFEDNYHIKLYLIFMNAYTYFTNPFHHSLLLETRKVYKLLLFNLIINCLAQNCMHTITREINFVTAAIKLI